MTPEVLHKCIPKASPENIAKYAEPLTMAMKAYDIDINKKRVAAFLAQVAHESGSLSAVKESFTYSASRLLEIFPKYFNAEQARQYANKPVKIANRVYANRYGNGDELSGDGWRYRGRGLFMVTFKDNYKLVGDRLKHDFVAHPEEIEDKWNSAFSAGFYWSNRGLNAYADVGDFIRITQKINGGMNGYQDRCEHWERIKKVLTLCVTV